MQSEIANKVFKEAFDLLKKKTDKLEEQLLEDHALFTKIQNGFKILAGMLKYAVISNEKYFSRIKEAHDNIETLEIPIPKNHEDIIKLYMIYPEALDDIKDELNDIVSIDGYEGLVLLSRVNPMLYYSFIGDDMFYEKIFLLEEDYNEFYIHLKSLTKKLLAKYIKDEERPNH